MALACRIFLAVLLIISTTESARISQRLVGGHAKVESSTNNKNDEPTEEKKTLAQQVSEGKYGLIQKELFEKLPERPGLISYGKNPDVPKDNENSLGGLGPDEIWLAEDHLLVLKGGAFHRTASELPWPPIDDYRAPNRQVKIPSHPKVPPPFPVQLTEGGPLELLGFNVTGTANGSLAISGPDGTTFILPPPDQDPSNTSAGRNPFPLPPKSGAFPENFHRGNGPAPFPFPFPPPPPPNLNQSLDEDDPSIYYPPPYSFFYPKDNSSKVPPGPLVPGIVLPPPPDFFGSLDSTTTTSTSAQTTTTSPPRTVIVQKPPNRYLPYDNSKHIKQNSQPTIIDIPTKVVTNKSIINLQEIPYDENELTDQKPSTPNPNEPTISTIPVLRIPYNENIQQKKLYSTPPPPTQSPIFHLPYDMNDHRPRTRLRPTSPPTTTPSIFIHQEQYENERPPPSRLMMPPFKPTVSTVPVIQVPRTYLRPTTVGPISNSVSAIPVVQVQYGNDKRPRTYLKPASGTQTASPMPVLQVPYHDQRPRTYLKPTNNPQVIHSSSPISVQYLPLNNNKDRVKATTIAPKPQTISSIPLIRVPFERAPPRTAVSSTSVPLKGYFSSVDVDSNSVQPQAEYYFYEEDSTSTPHSSGGRFRYVAPSNFEKHIQHLRQHIQSYLKPSARPVYEYSFQAANYRPTKPPTRYLTPAPPQQYINQRPTPIRYQQESPDHAYYTKQDERLLDDITKNYFTVFGQKITTPVTPAHSLHSDIAVNYRKPRPQINPEAEYINIRPQKINSEPEYINIRPQKINSEPEYINIRPQKVPHSQSNGPGAFISYALPGDGAHFYFLTPQLVQQQQQETQEKTYYYEKPEERIPRRNHR